MLTVILVIFSIVLLHFYFKAKFSYWEKRGLSGPKPWWFFGTTLQENFFFTRDKEAQYYKKYGPVFGTYSGTKPIFNTSDPDLIKEVLSRDDVFHSIGNLAFNDRYLEKGILFRNGHSWKQARQAMSQYFTSSKLRNLMNHYELVANNFLKNVENTRKQTGSDSIDVRLMSKCYCLDMIAKVLMAVDIDSFNQHKAEPNNEFVKHAMRIDEINDGQFILMSFLPWKITQLFNLNPLNPITSNSLGDLFKKMVRERKKQGVKYNDLTELMEDQIQEKNLDVDEDTVIGNSITNLFAGVDNVSINITTLLSLLVDHPEVKEKLYQEIKKDFSDEISYEKLMNNAYLDAVFCENNRLKSLILAVERTAMQDTKIGDYKIDKGTGIILLFDAVHNNPEYYPEPHKFKPERFLDKSSMNENRIDLQFAFSKGNKNCIGLRLAAIEIKYLLVKILLNYDIYKPVDYKREEINVRIFAGIKTCVLGFRKRNQ